MKEYKDYIAEIENAAEKNIGLDKLEFIGDFEVLSMRDEEGVPVAFALSNYGHVFEDINVLRIQDSESYSQRIAAEMADRGYVKYTHTPVSLAEKMAQTGHVFKDIEALKISNVANIMLSKGHEFSDEEFLELHSERTPLAHIAVQNGKEFTNNEILKLKNSNGDSVAHILASKGFQFEDVEIISLQNNKGYSVAHIMAEHGFEFKDKELLSLSDNNGRSVAHVQAEKGLITEVPDVLKLKNIRGESVAHIQANKGWETDNKEILSLQDSMGISLAEIYARKGKSFNDPDIYKLSNHHGKSVAYYMAKNGNAILEPDVLKDIVSVKVPNYARGYQSSNSRNRGYQNQYPDRINVSILDVLENSGKFDFNIDEIKNSPEILSQQDLQNGNPFVTSMYRKYGFVPSVEVAKKMNPNSMILFLHVVINKFTLEKDIAKFQHLLDDKELLLTKNSKDYSIALAFAKGGVKFDDPEIVELIKPKSAVNWRDGVFPSGKFKGQTFGSVADTSPDYLRWCHESGKFNINKYITKEDIDKLQVKPKAKAEVPTETHNDWQLKTFPTGKNEGKTFAEVLEKNPKYMEWCYNEKRYGIDKLIPLDEIKRSLDAKNSNINVVEKQVNKPDPITSKPEDSSNWEDLKMPVGKYKGTTLKELCNSKIGYVTYMHGQGMDFLTKNIPTEVINALNNDETLLAFQQKKAKTLINDAGELEI